MVVQIDTEEAFASVMQMRVMGLVVLGLTFLMAILGALLFNRRVVTPLKTSMNARRRLMPGISSITSPTKGGTKSDSWPVLSI